MASIPKPFKRPRIEIGAPSRTWGDWPIDQIRAGDIIPDIGQIESYKIEQLQFGNAFLVTYVNVMGDVHERKFPSSFDFEKPVPTVWAFH